MTHVHPSSLSDADLLSITRRAAAHERDATARLVALLAEVDARRLYLSESCSSMFVFCTRTLHMSEHAAYARIEAARAARRFPTILDRLADGRLTLTTVGLLAPISPARHPDRSTEAPAVPRALAGPPRRSIVAALAPRRYWLRVTIDEETQRKLERARDLLRHQIPDGDTAALLDRALTLLVTKAERTKFAATTRKGSHRPAAPLGASRRATAPAGASHPAAPPHPRPRRIPGAIRRAVWARDQGCCAFVVPAGRCGETGFLEFHHVVPFATGGASTIENLELRCRAHNGYEAELAGLARQPAESTRSGPSSAGRPLGQLCNWVTGWDRGSRGAGARWSDETRATAPSPTPRSSPGPVIARAPSSGGNSL